MTWSITDDVDERYFENYDMAKLAMDEFYLSVDAPLNQEYHLYTLNKECFKCPYLRYDSGNMRNMFNTNTKFKIANDSREYLPYDEEEHVICNIDQNFGQFGVYKINISNNNCEVETLLQPKNIFTPIFTVILIYVALFIFLFGLVYGWKKWKAYANKVQNEPNLSAKKERVRSLDTFRGISIVIMIFANFGAGGYGIFEHAHWNGIHLADVVFPWFLWIMGACIPISLSSSLKKNISNNTLVKRIAQRSMKLFVIGLILGSGTDLRHLRIFGVLQRFGVSYFCCSLICLYSLTRITEIPPGKLKAYFADIHKIYTGWIIVILILMIHTTIIFTVAAPGCPRGYLGPGGLHENRAYVNCTGGATGYIDSILLGTHRYQRPTIALIYETKAFDPEGIFGCLTTIVHVFIGVQAGITIMVYKKHQERLARFLIWASFTGLIGGSLCGFSKENGLIPVNKNLWSLSFVMVTCSLAFFLLSLTYLLVDVKKWWSGKPFLFSGMNALLMYIGHEMTAQMFPVRWYLHNDVRPEDPRRTHFISLLSDTWGVGVWVMISYYWYKINYFFNI